MLKGCGGPSGTSIPSVGRWGSGGGAGGGPNGDRGGGRWIYVAPGDVVQDPLENEGWNIYEGPSGTWIIEPPRAIRADAIRFNDGNTRYLGSGMYVGILGTSVYLTGALYHRRYRILFTARALSLPMHPGLAHFVLRTNDGLYYASPNFNANVLTFDWTEYAVDVDCGGLAYECEEQIIPVNGLYLAKFPSLSYILITYIRILEL